MESVEKIVHDERGIFTVEFVSDDGDIVSVRMALSDHDMLTKANAEAMAQEMLHEIGRVNISSFLAARADGSDPAAPTSDGRSQAAKSLEQERAMAGDEAKDQLQEGLESSFPASDPVSAAISTIPGGGPSLEEK